MHDELRCIEVGSFFFFTGIPFDELFPLSLKRGGIGGNRHQQSPGFKQVFQWLFFRGHGCDPFVDPTGIQAPHQFLGIGCR